MIVRIHGATGTTMPINNKDNMHIMSGQFRDFRIAFISLFLIAATVTIFWQNTSPGRWHGCNDKVENILRLLSHCNGESTVVDDVRTLSSVISEQVSDAVLTHLELYKSDAATACAPHTIDEDPSNSSTIYIVTPTYNRPEQIPELTRLAQTLKLVHNIHWLVVEDNFTRTAAVSILLNSKGVRHTYLTGPLPGNLSRLRKQKKLPRGVSNRLAGLKWVRRHVTQGVLYFADDDNTYDTALFEEMRDTKIISMWPVGLVTSLGVSTPIVKQAKVIGFYDGWISNRKFPIDMAGFAINIEYLLKKPQATMPYKVGYEEDGFLRSLGVNLTDIEPKAKSCTQILVWHTQSKKNSKAKKPNSTEKYKNTNMDDLLKQLV